MSADTITYNSHGYNDGDTVAIKNAGTTNLSTTTAYYVVSKTTNTIKLSLSRGGSAVDIGGTNTTAPTIAITNRWQLVRVEGAIFAGGAGDVVVLPAGFNDTDTATEASNGAVKFTLTAGQILPIQVKKVFSTGTTATQIVCLYGQ